MRARKARSRNTETRDAEDARRADDFNGRQSMIIRKPNGDAVTQRPCPNLRYCSSKVPMQFRPRGGYCRTCPSPFRDAYR